MKNRRRAFLKMSGLTWLGLTAGGVFKGFSSPLKNQYTDSFPNTNNLSSMENKNFDQGNLTVIGLYGEWAASLHKNKLPSFSFRKNDWPGLDAWRNSAKQRLADRLAEPEIGSMPKVTVIKQYDYDGLHIEELSWQLPYGRATAGILLKPSNAKGKLPGILAFHDHGGNKYFGTKKITRLSDHTDALIDAHQKEYYEGRAWANEIAKKGYVVLVADAFPFASRRVMVGDVPEDLRKGLNDEDPGTPEHVQAYNDWAAEHEHIMAKSLYSAGTTWPGVFLAEDRKALDILCAREDVDANRIGCGGLSGGGMRTIFMGGSDARIKCAVCVGFMTTWQDLVLYKSVNHTWMTYVPLLPNELDLPEILGLRVPLPTMVLNNEQDSLFTMPAMKEADQILSEVYKKATASDHYRCNFYPGPHKFDAAMQTDAFAWFDKWLKT